MEEFQYRKTFKDYMSIFKNTKNKELKQKAYSHMLSKAESSDELYNLFQITENSDTKKAIFEEIYQIRDEQKWIILKKIMQTEKNSFYKKYAYEVNQNLD